MMDLRTTYLGLELEHPLMPGASPLVDDLDTVRRLEDAGAAAIVMHSLFEEQISREVERRHEHLEAHEHVFAEALSYFPAPDEYALGPDRYLEQVRLVKDAVSVPVIGSLNGTSPEGWLNYARLIEQAGADAIELNFYYVATDPEETATQVEDRLVEIVGHVRHRVRVPIAVKLSPFFTSLPHLARRLADAGADGLVLFNRFYQPDIDPEMLEAVPHLHFSTSDELLLRVRWLAILSGRVRTSLAATGGVHTGLDALKAVMAGAHAVQLVAALLQRGPAHLAAVRRDLSHWLEEREYESLRQAQGSMSLERSPDPEAFERGNYMRALQSWKPRVRAGS
ncbi:MAG: dihydroorotate dehydrogenase-like protein [Vicinamibacterales bacterium]